MSSQPTEPDPRRHGGLWGRLRGLGDDTANPAEPASAIGPEHDAQGGGEEPIEAEQQPSDAVQREPDVGLLPEDYTPHLEAPPAEQQSVLNEFAPDEPIDRDESVLAVENETEDEPVEGEILDEVIDEADAEVPYAPAAPVQRTCPVCGTEGTMDEAYCRDCGYCFPVDVPTAVAAPTDDGESFRTGRSDVTSAVSRESARIPSVRVKQRYELVEQVREHGGVARFRGIDHGADGAPVTVIRAAALTVPEAVPVAQAPTEGGDGSGEEFFPVFDFPVAGAAAPVAIPAAVAWPSAEWERVVLASANHPSLPAVIDSFVEDGFEYVIEEVPEGQSLWDAWDEPDVSSAVRYGLLKQIAEALHALHNAGCMLEGIRPDIVCVDRRGRARLTDLSDLLPIPVPPDTPLRGTLYSAPELLSSPEKADVRADLYSFGAMLYALNEGRELTEMDFERGSPKSFILRYPESHPLLARLVTKTFNRDLTWRFPSDEAAREDASGFTELIHVLDTCGRVLDNVRLDIAAWTTTGIVRTGNEDGFGLIHSIEARQDDQGESTLIIVADGMGGYEGGEVAAAMAVNVIRKFLLQQKPFAHLNGGTPFSAEKYGSDSTNIAPVDVDAMKHLLATSLREANKQIYAASRAPGGKRGMGCTCEVVFVNGRHVVVGHVGDSRTYHYHEGHLIQLTRDQTLVNRLVELGRLTAEEAEKHEQRNQLSQAVGGQPDVIPGAYSGVMKPGDWVVVCSDGLTNHTPASYLAEMLKTESAEIAARRLVNSVLLEGATDNATVVLVRAT
jgi:protein phosphatase